MFPLFTRIFELSTPLLCCVSLCVMTCFCPAGKKWPKTKLLVAKMIDLSGHVFKVASKVNVFWQKHVLVLLLQKVSQRRNKEFSHEEEGAKNLGRL